MNISTINSRQLSNAIRASSYLSYTEPIDMEQELTNICKTNFIQIDSVLLDNKTEKTRLVLFCYVLIPIQNTTLRIPIRMDIFSHYFPTIQPYVLLVYTYGYVLNDDCGYISKTREISCTSLANWTKNSSLVGVLKEIRYLFLRELPIQLKPQLSLEEASLIKPISFESNLPIIPIPENLVLIKETKYDCLYKGVLPDKIVYVRQYMSTTNTNFLLGILTRLYMEYHPNIAQVFGCCIMNKKPCIVYEYIDTSLLDFVKANVHSPILIQSYVKQICRGLRWMYTMEPSPIYHRDLRIENIYITETNVVKLNHLAISENSITSSTPVSLDTSERFLFSGQQYTINTLTTDYNEFYELFMFGFIIYELFKQIPLHEYCRQLKKLKKKIEFSTVCEDIPLCVQTTLKKLWYHQDESYDIYELFNDIQSWSFS